MNCIFCEAALSEENERHFVLHRAKHSFVLLNRYPYSTGHLMIAPYEHTPRLQGISEEAADEIMRLTRQAEQILEEVYSPAGLNLGMNLGEVAGAGIAGHIHMHVLPRWQGDANFMTVIGETRIMPEALETTYAKLAGKFA